MPTALRSTRLDQLSAVLHGNVQLRGAPLLDKGKDPFLFWLLSILPEDVRDPESRWNCYIFKHAGDDDL